MITPFGAAAVRQDVIPLPPLEPHPGGIAYVDTETTGLSGGAGTYVFAAAVARPIECGLRVSQFFLPEPGMESAFLHALREEVEVADGLATFNGGSFDLPILRTRWVMARMPGEFSHAPHVDLLTLVRALYRHRLDSCTLRMVEQRVLGYERDDPLPSAMVPDAYFDYLRAGAHDFLEAALEHNRLDVISLVHLHSRLLRRLQGADIDMDANERHRFRKWRGGGDSRPFDQSPPPATRRDLRRRPAPRLARVERAGRRTRFSRSRAAPRVAASRSRTRAVRGRGGAASHAGSGKRPGTSTGAPLAKS
jgi:hypothetical protein